MASPEQSNYLDERSENRDEHKKGRAEARPMGKSMYYRLFD